MGNGARPRHGRDRERTNTVGPPPAAGPPSALRWTLLCAAAEAVGMAAATAAVAVSAVLFGDPVGAGQVFAVVALILAGGLVEGAALGSAQALGLRRWLRSVTRPWVLVTVLVAGLGWAAGSLPSVLSDGGGGAGPPLPAVLGGACALGAAMGALLGTAQALVLRGRVAHPWRWVVANALAWAGAMPVIFLGASGVPEGWTGLALIPLGAVTGAAAGAVLGAVSGLFLSALR